MERKKVSEKTRKNIYFFNKSVFYIMTCVIVYVYTRTMYSVDWTLTAVKNSGMTVSELFFCMGVILGVWCFFAYLLLVFTNYEVEKDGKTDNGKQLCMETLHKSE